MDGGSGEVEVHITVEVDVFLLVGGLHLATLLSCLWVELGVECQFQAFDESGNPGQGILQLLNTCISFLFL